MSFLAVRWFTLSGSAASQEEGAVDFVGGGGGVRGENRLQPAFGSKLPQVGTLLAAFLRFRARPTKIDAKTTRRNQPEEIQWRSPRN